MDAPPLDAEIAIVGGGLAGLATAWALAERGLTDVVVLEREAALATHASGRNAAMCRALAEDDAWTAWTAAGAAFLRHPPPGFSATPLVDRRGAVLLARPEVAAVLAARASRFGLPCAATTAEELRRRWPLLDVAGGGLLFPDDGCVDLTALIAGYALGARRAGARLVTAAPCLELTSRATGAAITTPRGVVRARKVVLAAGAWAGEVGGLTHRTLGFEARRRHVFALAAPARGYDPGAPIVWNVDGDEWYVRPADAEVWTSACDSDRVAAGMVEVRPDAEDLLRRRLPSTIADLRSARAWACQRTFAPTGHPLVAPDEVHEWLYWVAGLGGHGVTASAAVGRAAAAMLAGATG